MSLIFVIAALVALLPTAASCTASPAASALLPRLAAPCPCADPALCRPIQTTHQREVFGFSVDQTTPYERYDWSQLTTVAWNEDPALLCAAHAAGARVVLDGRFDPAAVLHSAAARTAWVALQLDKARRLHLDGINFDLEVAIPAGHPLASNYTDLVNEAAVAFHAAIPGSQISVDVPWSPHGIDGRSYDWLGLAAAADLLFIMAYDMQSQIWGSCVASANSPAALVLRGARQWLELGLPAKKLVLGLPWYGYRYPCTNPAYAAGQEQMCTLPPTPFRGAPCSDAVGAQTCYSDIVAAMRRGSSGSGRVGAGTGSGALHSSSRRSDARGGNSGGLRAKRVVHALADNQRSVAEEEEGELLVCEPPQFDEGQRSPFTACRWAADPPGSRRFQIWFDSAASLAAKYALAAQLGLRGVGVWNLDCLDYHCTDAACRQETEGMWVALRAFTEARSSGSAQPAQQQASGWGQGPGLAGTAASTAGQRAAKGPRAGSELAAD